MSSRIQNLVFGNHGHHGIARREARQTVVRPPHRHATVTEHIQAASQPQLTRHRIEIAVCLTIILLVSICGVAGILPEAPGGATNATTSDASRDSAQAATQAAAEQLLSGKSVAERLSTIDGMYQTADEKAELYNAVGVGCLSAKNIKGAIAAFNKALTANPTLAAAQNNLGMAMLQAGDTRAAHAAFQSVLRQQPDNTYAASQLEQLGQ